MFKRCLENVNVKPFMYTSSGARYSKRINLCGYVGRQRNLEKGAGGISRGLNGLLMKIGNNLLKKMDLVN